MSDVAWRTMRIIPSAAPSPSWPTPDKPYSSPEHPYRPLVSRPSPNCLNFVTGGQVFVISGQISEQVLRYFLAAMLRSNGIATKYCGGHNDNNPSAHPTVPPRALRRLALLLRPS